MTMRTSGNVAARARSGDWPGLAELGELLRAGTVSAVELTAAALGRIAEVDPLVNAVLAVDPSADAQAEASDRRLRAGIAGPLEGVPVLLKDNIDTAGFATTAGSRLLSGCPPRRDAGVVAALRAAGAVVLGKTNLSEWGNFRSTMAPEGWSAVGGQTRNPHALGHSPWGSSAGSAAAVAAGMAPLALGTETDGSIVCPAAVCGVVGLKPAPGTLPRRGIVPISAVQDTAGLLCTSVPDAAHAYAALRGGSPAGVANAPAVRLGVWTGRRFDPAAHAALDAVVSTLRAAGVVTVTVALAFDRERLDDGLHAMIAQYPQTLARYLRTRPGAPPDLDAVLAGNRADPVELSLFGQDLMEYASEFSPPQRAAARTRGVAARRWARAELRAVMAEHGLSVILAPTAPPAWPLDPAAGDPAAPSSSTLPALAGYPIVTVPTGAAAELPTGVSVFGPASVGPVLAVAALVEQLAGDRRTPGLRDISAG